MLNVWQQIGSLYAEQQEALSVGHEAQNRSRLGLCLFFYINRGES